MALLAQTQQVVETVGTNTQLLTAILTGTLLATVTGGYRFVVNFRKTERGLSRARIKQANANERAAQYEASLWQGRAADLEYLLRQQTGRVPPLSKELLALVQSVETATDPLADEKGEDDQTGGRPER